MFGYFIVVTKQPGFLHLLHKIHMTNTPNRITGYSNPVNSIFLLICLFISSLTFVSCHKDEPAPTRTTPVGMSVLLYAIASDLPLEADKREILRAAESIDLNNNSFYLYQVYETGKPELLKLTNEKGVAGWQVVKTYDRSLYSTDPEQISTVIEDFRNMGESDQRGIIFWSHGTGWTPSFSNHGQNETSNAPVLYSFGADKDRDRDKYYTDKCDIDELADAIPDNMFEFIWFDVCYMGGIETIYQLRNKCKTFVGMPTEDAGNGMPYDICLPYLMHSNPECLKAAKEFFEYYRDGKDVDWAVATIAVADMSKIEPVAAICRDAYTEGPVPSAIGLQKYSRGSNGPFYDFGQYTRIKADLNPTLPDMSEFDKVMNDFIIYKGATERDFAGNIIDQDNFSGISCHLYNPADKSANSEYYRSLDWYKRVYE